MFKFSRAWEYNVEPEGLKQIGTDKLELLRRPTCLTESADAVELALRVALSTDICMICVYFIGNKGANRWPSLVRNEIEGVIDNRCCMSYTIEATLCCFSHVTLYKLLLLYYNLIISIKLQCYEAYWLEKGNCLYLSLVYSGEIKPVFSSQLINPSHATWVFHILHQILGALFLVNHQQWLWKQFSEKKM